MAQSWAPKRDGGWGGLVKHDARIENIFQTKQTHQAKNGRTRVKLKVKREQKKKSRQPGCGEDGEEGIWEGAAWQRVCVPLIMRCTASRSSDLIAGAFTGALLTSLWNMHRSCVVGRAKEIAPYSAWVGDLLYVLKMFWFLAFRLLAGKELKAKVPLAI